MYSSNSGMRFSIPPDTFQTSTSRGIYCDDFAAPTGGEPAAVCAIGWIGSGIGNVGFGRDVWAGVGTCVNSRSINFVAFLPVPPQRVVAILLRNVCTSSERLWVDAPVEGVWRVLTTHSCWSSCTDVASAARLSIVV